MRAVLLWLGVLAASPAFAQDPAPPPTAPSDADKARAKELFDNGQILYEEGHYEDAIAAWEESYRLSGYADLLFNISNADERLGRYHDAIEKLNRYRAFAPSDERQTLDRRISALQDRLAGQYVPPVVPPPVTPPPVVPPPVVPTPEEHLPATAETTHVRVLPIALLGGGAVGLGVGGVFAVRAGGAMGEIKDACSLDTNSGKYLCPSSAADAASARQHAATASAVAMGVGGALALGGVAVVIVGGGGASDLALSVGPEVGGARLRLGGSF
jgi:tetratricopeptide (TPR) repeat protein